MIRLAIALCALALAGCGPRVDLPGSLDVRASYEHRHTSRPTLPRCYKGTRPMGNRYTSADVSATLLLGIGVVEEAGVETEYKFPPNVISIEPWMPRGTLLHEDCHAGQMQGGHFSKWQNEAGAMICEVAALMAEGWSDDQIRALSRNNSQTPDWVFAWIRQFGPQFRNDESDIVVAYQWGKSDAAWLAVGSLIGAP